MRRQFCSAGEREAFEGLRGSLTHRQGGGGGEASSGQPRGREYVLIQLGGGGV